MDEEQKIEDEIKQLDQRLNARHPQPMQPGESKLVSPLQYSSRFKDVDLQYGEIDVKTMASYVQGSTTYQQLVDLLSKFKQLQQKQQRDHSQTISDLLSCKNEAQQFLAQAQCFPTVMYALQQEIARRVQKCQASFNQERFREQQQRSSLSATLEGMQRQANELEVEKIDLLEKTKIAGEQLQFLEHQLEYYSSNNRAGIIAALQEQLQELVSIKNELLEQLQVAQ